MRALAAIGVLEMQRSTDERVATVSDDGLDLPYMGFTLVFGWR